MKILKRIKRIIELSKKDAKALEMFESLTPKQIKEIPEEKIEGDGNAVFFSQGTEQDFLEFEREEKGLKGWYERLKNL